MKHKSRDALGDVCLRDCRLQQWQTRHREAVEGANLLPSSCSSGAGSCVPCCSECAPRAPASA